MVEAFPKRKPLLPIIHNPKALLADKEEKAAQVRCFYALAHRGANPIESDFHMQARLGFRRRNNNKVRLRPIELLPQVEKPKPAMAADRQTGMRRSSQERPPSKRSALSEDNVGKFSPGSKQLPVRSSVSSRRNSNSPMGPEGRSSPVSVVDMDFAGVTWTTFSKVTDQTVGTVISGALGEMSDDYGRSESMFERLDKDAKAGKARTPLGKKPADRSPSEIISFCALPPQVTVADEQGFDLAWKAHAKEKAALVIQSQRRGQTCRKSLKEHRVAKETAAVRLQKLQRGRLARKKTLEMRRKTMEMKAKASSVCTNPNASNPSVIESTPPVEEQTAVVESASVVEEQTTVIESTPAVEEETAVVENSSPEASNAGVVENTLLVEEQTAVVESTPSVEEETTVVENTSSRSKSYKQNRELRKTARRSFEDLDIAPENESAIASDLINSDAMVSAQDSSPARFSQLPSVGSWLRLR